MDTLTLLFQNNVTRTRIGVSMAEMFIAVIMGSMIFTLNPSEVGFVFIAMVVAMLWAVVNASISEFRYSLMLISKQNGYATEMHEFLTVAGVVFGLAIGTGIFALNIMGGFHGY